MVDSSLELETGPWTEDSFHLQVVILNHDQNAPAEQKPRHDTKIAREAMELKDNSTISETSQAQIWRPQKAQTTANAISILAEFLANSHLTTHIDN